MKTLYEELLKLPILEQNIAHSLNSATRVRANNVYHYMEEDKKDFNLLTEHLPVVIPPFPVMWIEFDVGSINTTGYLLIREKIGQENILKLPRSILMSNGVWALYAQMFSRSGEVLVKLPDGTSTKIHLENGKAPVSFLLTLRSDGTIIDEKSGISISFAKNYEATLKSAGIFDDSIVAEKTIFSVVLFSLSLMNCKNVKLENIDPPTTIKHRNRHARPAISYHVLKIRPMSIHTRGGGEWKGSPGKLSIHIRRGHFKDYRTGPGLFGKYHDIYWWESEVVGRGSTQVDKEYDIYPN